MNSKVTKLYNYAHAEIPGELRLWRVSEEEIDRQLAALSHSHARELDVEEIQAGDSVVCRGESAVRRWNRPVLLFYPGHGLCEKVMEDALVGMKPGESKAVAASEGDVTLTVKRIIRRKAYPIGDELVKLEAVEGVETVADYRRWYRQSNEARNRSSRIALMARWLLHQTIAGSAYEIDEAEEYEWVRTFSNMYYDAEVANGIDPTVPEDGTEFLTEEQARQLYFDQCRPMFRQYLAHMAVTERLAGTDAETYYQAARAEFTKSRDMERETLSEKAKEFILRIQTFDVKAAELMRNYCEQLLEE